LIKFDLFLEQALSLWCSHVATWHYARTQQSDNQTLLLRWVDQTKDQSYFLSQLNQKQLKHAIFPVGEIPKSEVRKIAEEIWLPNADRPDSQGLCFIGDVPIAEFLQKKIKPTPGDVINTVGEKVWTHNGAIYYTLWQRHGFQTPFRAYITNINTEANTITVTENREDPMLYTTSFTVTNRHRITGDQDTHLNIPENKFNCQIKIRYRQAIPTPGHITNSEKHNDWSFIITLSEAQWAVAPGQFAVAYDGDTIIWSWVIDQRIA
jgi:tRNA-specific 2-thiouridylase